MANRKNATIALLGLLAALISPASLFAAVPQTVGQVTLVIGDGNRISPDGQKVNLKKGDSLLEGDSIETSAGGYVHVRFLDGAQVSVRPSSRLAIEAYHQDENGVPGAIRFKLEAGTVRSVTGKWGEANHDRFRLNTPIAAIGIRGTDFVVQSEAERVRVVVQSGAIVMAPLDGGGCQQAGLGVCNTAAAKRLSADMGDVMLELRRRQPAPELIPLRNLLPSERLHGGDVAKPSSREAVPGVAAPAESGASAEKTPVATVKPPVADIVVPPPELPQIAKPVPPVPPVLPRGNELVWARMYPAWIGDNLSKDFADVKAGHQVTVGNSTGQYILLRAGADGADMRPAFAAGLGRVQFNLEYAQANLVQDGIAQQARVEGGALAVDFANRRFDAALAVSHDAVGTVNIAAQGDVDRNTGIMLGGNVKGDGRVVGALSSTGREAGLSFDRQTDKGLVTGITLWGR